MAIRRVDRDWGREPISFKSPRKEDEKLLEKRRRDEIALRKYALHYAMKLMAGGSATADDVIDISNRFYNFIIGVIRDE